MIKTAAILAGGQGSRLATLNLKAPKGLLRFNGVALISQVIHQLASMNVHSIFLLCGYKADNYLQWVKNNSVNVNADLNVIKEDSIKGTGGAIYNWFKKSVEKNMVVMNGDMIIDLDFLKPYLKEPCVTCKLFVNDLKGDRYGGVTVDENFEFIGFSEKTVGQFTSLGVYVFNRDWFIEKVVSFKLHNRSQFSLERDFFSRLKPGEIQVIITETRFIDIGTVDEFQANQLEDDSSDLR